FDEGDDLPSTLREYVTSLSEPADLALSDGAHVGFAWPGDRLVSRLETHRRALDEYPDGILICNADDDLTIRWCNRRFRWWYQSIRERVRCIRERDAIQREMEERAFFTTAGVDILSGDAMDEFGESPPIPFGPDALPESPPIPPMPDPYGPIPGDFPDLRDGAFLKLFPIASVSEGRFTPAETSEPIGKVRELIRKTLTEFTRGTTDSSGVLTGIDNVRGSGDPGDAGKYTVVHEMILETEDYRRFRFRIQPFHGRVRNLLFLMLRDETSERNSDKIQESGEILEEMAERLVASRDDLSLEELEQELRRLVVEQTRSLLEYRYFWMRKFDRETNTLVLKLDDPERRHGKPLVLHVDEKNNGIAGLVAKTGKGYLCRDTLTDPYYHSWHWSSDRDEKDAAPQTPGQENDAGVLYARSCIVVPMRRHGELFGTINVESDYPDAFNESDVFALDIYARYLASAMNTLERSDEVRNRAAAKQLERFHEEISPLSDQMEQTLREMSEGLTRLGRQISDGTVMETSVSDPDSEMGTLRERVADARGQISYLRGRMSMVGGGADQPDDIDKPTLFIAHRDSRIVNQLLLEGFGATYHLIWTGPGQDVLDILVRKLTAWGNLFRDGSWKSPFVTSVTDDPDVRRQTPESLFRTPLAMEENWVRGLWFGPEFLVLTGVRCTDGLVERPAELTAEQKSPWLVGKVRELVNQFAPKFHPVGVTDPKLLSDPCPDVLRPPQNLMRYPVPVVQMIPCIRGIPDGEHVQVAANGAGAVRSIGIDLTPGQKQPFPNLDYLRTILRESLALLPFVTKRT
ncbi:MAG: GAF domain-containing protein, partial [Planctomycetia bacterium]|nr:GAF domain-containing protein [Planctomycetia bacterium]